MKFDELDRRMRIYETAHDHCVLPGLHIVVRLDGRGFTRLTKELLDLEAPFDIRFRDAMLGTTEHLFDCGFQVIYGYAQSDEISLLLHADDNTFGRKLRKIISVLPGEASASFSMAMHAHASFDARVSQLPSRAKVVDYFRWRHEDAHRNSLNAHCYWQLRRQGLSADSATDQLRGMSTAQKNELLFQNGINFNDLPAWQKRGMAVYWETYEKCATDPRTGMPVSVTRRHLRKEFELPLGDDYAEFVKRLIEGD